MDRIARLLLIEDNPGDADLVREALSTGEPAVEITVVERVADALTWLDDRSTAAEPLPDLIIHDLNLPGVHGIQGIRMIKDDPQWKLVPLLVLSSSEIESERTICRELGAAAFWSKPRVWEEYEEFAVQLRRSLQAGQFLMQRAAWGDASARGAPGE
jgi:two-component system, chemotaxis family, response regulator Rcp1